jgi:hypothetical protein
LSQSFIEKNRIFCATFFFSEAEKKVKIEDFIQESVELISELRLNQMKHLFSKIEDVARSDRRYDNGL